MCYYNYKSSVFLRIYNQMSLDFIDLHPFQITTLISLTHLNTCQNLQNISDISACFIKNIASQNWSKNVPLLSLSRLSPRYKSSMTFILLDYVRCKFLPTVMFSNCRDYTLLFRLSMSRQNITTNWRRGCYPVINASRIFSSA